MTLLTSATTGTDSAAGLRRRRRFLIVFAIGAGAVSGCFFVRRFRLGMPRNDSRH